MCYKKKSIGVCVKNEATAAALVILQFHNLCLRKSDHFCFNKTIILINFICIGPFIEKNAAQSASHKNEGERIKSS